MPTALKLADRQRRQGALVNGAFRTVARSWDPLELEIFRARLQAEGIAAFVADEGINQLNALYSIAVGGARLMVAEEDAAPASRIIDLLRSGRFALDGDGEIPD